MCIMYRSAHSILYSPNRNELANGTSQGVGRLGMGRGVAPTALCRAVPIL